MPAHDDRSLAELIASLARDVPDLLGKEIHLARVEAKSALDHLTGALGRLALALALAVGAVGLALAAMVSGLTAWLVSRGLAHELAAAISTTTITLIAILIAAAFYWSARRSLRAARNSLDDSLSTLSESAANVMDKF